jgi:hypothetical protein
MALSKKMVIVTNQMLGVADCRISHERLLATNVSAGTRDHWTGNLA